MIKYALTVKQSLLFTELSLRGNTKFYFRKAFHINYELPECLIRENDIFWNFDSDTEYNDAFLKNRTLNQAIAHFNNSLAHATKNLEEIAKKIFSSNKMLSSNQKILLKQLTDYYDAYLLNMPFLFLYWNTEHLLIQQLKEDFQVVFGEDSRDILQQLLVPAHETYFSKEKKSIQKIISYVNKNRLQKSTILKGNSRLILKNFPDLKKLISQHIKDFAFTTTSLYLGKPLTEKDIIDRIKNGIKEYSSEKAKEQETQEKNALFYRKKLLKNLESFPEIKERLQLASELMFWKNQRLDSLFQSDFLINPLLNNIASLMGYSFQEFVYLTYGEILLWFKDGTLVDRKILIKRMKTYAVYLNNGSISVLIDKKEYPKVPAANIIHSSQISSKIIKGSIACRGKAVGKVRLVFVTEDIGNIKRGEILVTPMTRPDMILGMEKAAAFVTDHGGMLSHAAIIAREMKKPCIVGTQNATKILKNGMYIEVNANDGVVRILD